MLRGESIAQGSFGAATMRIGVIGLQGHDSVVLRGAETLGGCQVVAVSDDDEAAVARYCERNPLARTAEKYRNWQHLLEHTMMDVCVVADENGRRVEQLLALLARNIHIVAEKPLATTLDDLNRLRPAIARARSRVTMLMTMRHEPKYAKFRELVKAGAVGDINLITAQKSYRLGTRPEWQKSRARLGGTIPFIGVHPLDLIRFVTGLDYTHVAAFHGNLGRPEMRETEVQASLLLRMTNGASTTVRLDYLRPETAPTHGDDRLRIAGSRGVLEALGGEDELSLISGTDGPSRVRPEPVDNLFVAFVRALRENRPTPIPVEECLSLTELVLRAREAADTQQLLTLPASRAARNE